MKVTFKQAELSAQIDTFINQSHDHAANRKALFINVLAWSCEHGRVELLNKIAMGAARSDRDAMRIYIVNLTMDYGTSTVGTNGRERFISPFTFSAEKGFAFAKTDDARETRKRFNNLSAAQFAKVEMEPRTREAADSGEYSLDAFETAISRLLTKALKESVLSTAQIDQFNKLLSATARVDPAAIAKDENDKRERLIKQATKAGLVVTMPKSETKAETPAETPAAKPVPAKQEPKAA